MMEHHHLPSLSPSSKNAAEPHFAIRAVNNGCTVNATETRFGLSAGKSFALEPQRKEAETAKQESPETVGFARDISTK